MMKRLFAFLLLLAIAAPLCAQDPAPAETDTATEEEPVGVPVDYNKYLKKLYPDIDPGGKHDIFNLKNPSSKDERHEYTVAMAQLLIEYLSPNLDFGATLSKLFDQYSRGKEANSPVFKTLYAIVLLYYPPGNPNTTQAEQLLREAAELAKDYAYPHFMLAQFEFARLVQVEGVSPRVTLQHIDKALELRPGFLRAVLLKCEVYFQYQQDRTKEILEMIKPYLNEDLPKVGYDFEDVLKVYARCSGTDLQERLDKYMNSGTLTETQKITVLELSGQHHMEKLRYDEAIGKFEEILKFTSVDSDPAEVLKARKWLAMAWDMKARDLKKQLADPEVKKRHDEFVEKSLSLHRACAELEAKEMPISMRGGQAMQYVEVLAFGLDRKQEAVDWLAAYLESTDLTRSQRNRLDNIRATLQAYLDPSEENKIAIYRGKLERGDLEGLAASLGTAWERLRVSNESFKESGSLSFFLESLDTGNRAADGYAALLAAATAKQLGADAIKKAGDAILKRLEKESELKSEAQASIHKQLAEALKLLESWEHIEKAVLHSAKMIKSAKDELNVRALTQPIIDNWNDEALLAKLKPAMKKASRMDVYTPEDAADWMTKKLAAGIKKTAEAVAKEEAEKKEAEKKAAEEAEKKEAEEPAGE